MMSALTPKAGITPKKKVGVPLGKESAAVYFRLGCTNAFLYDLHSVQYLCAVNCQRNPGIKAGVLQ